MVRRVMSSGLARAKAAIDLHQIEVAKELFQWWWEAHRGTLFQTEDIPTWDEVPPEPQAFWMDGAWRMIRVG